MSVIDEEFPPGHLAGGCGASRGAAGVRGRPGGTGGGVGPGLRGKCAAGPVGGEDFRDGSGKAGRPGREGSRSPGWGGWGTPARVLTREEQQQEGGGRHPDAPRVARGGPGLRSSTGGARSRRSHSQGAAWPGLRFPCSGCQGGGRRAEAEQRRSRSPTWTSPPGSRPPSPGKGPRGPGPARPLRPRSHLRGPDAAAASSSGPTSPTVSPQGRPGSFRGQSAAGSRGGGTGGPARPSAPARPGATSASPAIGRAARTGRDEAPHPCQSRADHAL